MKSRVIHFRPRKPNYMVPWIACILFAWISIYPQQVFAARISLIKLEYAPYADTSLPPEQIYEDQTVLWETTPRLIATSPRFWTKVSFRASDVNLDEELIIGIRESIPKDLQFTLFSDSGKVLSQSLMGGGVALENWQGGEFSPGHRFRLHEDGNYTFIMRVDTSFVNPVRFKIGSYDEYLRSEMYKNLALALSLGGIGSVLLYNVLLWRSLRRKIFLSFAFLNAMYVLQVCQISGVLDYFTAAFAPDLATAQRIVPILTMAAFFRFVISYLKLAETSLGYRWLNGSAVILCGAGMLSLVSPTAASWVAYVTFSVGLVALNLTLIHSYVRGQRHAMPLFVGSLPLFLMIALWNPFIGGVANLSLREVVPLSLLCQMLFTGAGLANRITEVREKLFETLAAKADVLEDQVRERTLEFHEANEILKVEIEVRRAAEERAKEQTQLLEEAQARLVSTSRLGALGDMASGISHEINNPLTILKGYLFLMQETLHRAEPDHERMKSMISKSLVTADRMANVTRALREFALQDQIEDPVDICLSKNWEMTMNLRRERIRDLGISCHVEPWDYNIHVLARPADLAQAIMSCLHNAIDAVNHLESKWIRVSVLADDMYVTIRIVDAGRGIDPQIVEKLFTPFFTTKDPGAGTGLGLSIAKQLMKSAGGDLRYVAGEAHTTFEIMMRRSYAMDDTMAAS